MTPDKALVLRIMWEKAESPGLNWDHLSRVLAKENESAKRHSGVVFRERDPNGITLEKMYHTIILPALKRGDLPYADAPQRAENRHVTETGFTANQTSSNTTSVSGNRRTTRDGRDVQEDRSSAPKRMSESSATRKRKERDEDFIVEIDVLSEGETEARMRKQPTRQKKQPLPNWVTRDDSPLSSIASTRSPSPTPASVEFDQENLTVTRPPIGQPVAVSSHVTDQTANSSRPVHVKGEPPSSPQVPGGYIRDRQSPLAELQVKPVLPSSQRRTLSYSSKIREESNLLEGSEACFSCRNSQPPRDCWQNKGSHKCVPCGTGSCSLHPTPVNVKIGRGLTSVASLLRGRALDAMSRGEKNIGDIVLSVDGLIPALDFHGGDWQQLKEVSKDLHKVYEDARGRGGERG
ncbi:hypothetical protein M231_02053 [Tremella mesenterica]|uniref:Uncharacterized protein n=1 Tax=Tremella mesenterica TaxID=5217 RepID=A0A4Q1BRK6_TREME|nr:hypothetical protein M231_02053 [Tremella mesenterica]